MLSAIMEKCHENSSLTKVSPRAEEPQLVGSGAITAVCLVAGLMGIPLDFMRRSRFRRSRRSAMTWSEHRTHFPRPISVWQTLILRFFARSRPLDGSIGCQLWKHLPSFSSVTRSMARMPLTPTREPHRVN